MFESSLQQPAPSGDFCFGRDRLCTEIVKSAFQARSALLFGGRQSGKTTVLLRIAKILGEKTANAGELAAVDVPVYVDLMKLPHNAGPSETFRFLSKAAQLACEKQIDGFDLRTLPSDKRTEDTSLDLFVSDINAILSAGKEVRVRLLFLLDEAKRIVSSRFPRAFQDNLFALLYDEELGIGSKIAIVFSGAQDLYQFCIDDTSPIGSRATTHFITNLSVECIQEIIEHIDVDNNLLKQEGLATQMHEQTGGHAGLSVKLGWKLMGTPSESSDLQDAVSELRKRHVMLLRIWVNSLSDEARAVQDSINARQELSISEIASILRDNNLDPFNADRVIEELQYTGIAIYANNQLRKCNHFYWDYVKDFVGAELASRPEKDVWQLIEEVELSLRARIREKYEGKWPGALEQRVLKCFGPEEQQKISRLRISTASQYRYSTNSSSEDVLDYLYLGQLGQLMISNSAWDMFKLMFRDKREMEDMFSAISPVRNDRAHFRMVPPKELDRCKIACEDLLVILEKSATTL